MYDWLTLAAVAAELRDRVLGARVERVYQPEHTTVLLHLHRDGRRYPLLLSAHPQFSRLHLTGLDYHNPPQPPPFCMLLRKHLVGGRLEKVQQPPGERLLELCFAPPVGRQPSVLVAEVMGRRSNVLLLDKKRIILGAMKFVSGTRNRYRTVQTGETYRPPPPQKKLDPHAVDPAGVACIIEEHLHTGKTPEQALLKTVQGVSPLLARELVCRSRLEESGTITVAERLARQAQQFFEKTTAEPAAPEVAWSQDVFAAYPLTFIPAKQRERFDSMNELCDRFFGRAIAVETEERLRQSLGSVVRQNLHRTGRRKEQQEADLTRAARSKEYRFCGELILTYLNRIPPRAGRIELPNPYQPGEQVTVELLPTHSPSENARRYFNLYRKAKSGLKQAGRQLEQTREEIRYLEGVLFAIESADRKTLLEIRSELVEQKLMRAEGQKRQRSQSRAGRGQGQSRQGQDRKQQFGEALPLRFVSSGGYTLLVGRNNRQNERLTFATASRRDLWLHARELPGSHVLARGFPEPPPEVDLEEAALLAAHFSKGRSNPAVAVDYTAVRHVRRAPGGRPGRVLYTNSSTITVNPAGPRLQALLKQLPSHPFIAKT